MGRVTGTTIIPRGGRVSRRMDNKFAENKPIKTWETMSLGEKVWNTTIEVPGVLYSFLPPSMRESLERAKEEKRLLTTKEALGVGVKGAAELGVGAAEVTKEAISGLGLYAKKKIFGGREDYTIPGFKRAGEVVSQVSPTLGDMVNRLGEISSYGVQVRKLEEQGFSKEEAKALVGINAYLGLAPAISKLSKLPVIGRVKKSMTETTIPVSETPQGIRSSFLEREVPSGETIVERPVVTAIKEKLGQTKEQKLFHQILEDHLDKYFEGRKELLGREDPLNKALVSLSKEELDSYSDITQGFYSGKVTEGLKTAVDLWKKANKQIESDLINRGKLTLEQVENRRWKPVETITGRSREELAQAGVEPIYYPYLSETRLAKSDFIPTTGKRTKGGYLKRFTGKLLAEDSYIKNPKVAIPRHRIQVFRDKMNNELVESIRTNFSERDPEIVALYKKRPDIAEMMGVEEWKPQGNLRFYPTEKGVGVTKNVESYWIPKTVSKELNRFYKPGWIEKTMRMTYDPLIDMWRVSILNLIPRWIYNNFMGNSVLATLAKTDPVAFAKSAKELFARTSVGEKMGVSKRDIPKGVLQKEYAGGEIPKADQLGGLARETTQFLRPIENWLNLLEQAKQFKGLRIPAIITQGIIRGWVALGRPGGYVNKVVENWFRAAVYISKIEGKFLGVQLDKPVPPAEGLNYVNEFLFDYSRLSRAERATFRRALPFWNWQKNITQFAFKFPIKHPIRGLVVGALLQDYVDYINEVNQAEDKSKSVLRIKTDMEYEGKPLYLNIKSAIPFSDVFRTLPTNFKAFGRFLTSNPVSKIIIERAFGINSFTGQPFTAPRELQKFDEYGKPIPPLPSLTEHIGMQFPQVKLGQQISDELRYGETLKRYETGEPKMFHGKIQTTDLLMEILGYFGIRLSPVEYNKIIQQVEKKERIQGVQEKRYQRQIESGLKRFQQN